MVSTKPGRTDDVLHFDDIYLNTLVESSQAKWRKDHPMRISLEGIEFIKEHEGCEFCAYKDSGGTLTIGYGHTGADFTENTLWTQEQCDAALTNDLAKVVRCVNEFVTHPMTQNQFDALCSFAFNLGCRALANSTLLRLLNSGDYEGAAAEFKKWDHVNHVEDDGLLARREAESALFMEA